MSTPTPSFGFTDAGVSRRESHEYPRRPWTNPDTILCHVVRQLSYPGQNPGSTARFTYPSMRRVLRTFPTKGSGRQQYRLLRSQVADLWYMGAIHICIQTRHICLTEEAANHPDVVELIWKRAPA